MKLNLWQLIKDLEAGDEKAKDLACGLIDELINLGMSFDVCDKCGYVTESRYTCRNCGNDSSLDDTDDELEDDR